MKLLIYISLILLCTNQQPVHDYTNEMEFNVMCQDIGLGTGYGDEHSYYLIDSDIDFEDYSIELNNATLTIPDERVLYYYGMEITKEDAYEFGGFKEVGNGNHLNYRDE